MSLWTASTNPSAYPSPPSPPSHLSRQLCLSSTALGDFLKLSRYATDDAVKQRINSRFTEDRSKSQTQICGDVWCEYLTVWGQRAGVIRFCDEEAVKLRTELESDQEDEIQTLITNVDLRHNPYALKDIEDLKERKFEQLHRLEGWVRNEKGVEEIVQRRTKEVLSGAGCAIVDDA